MLRRIGRGVFALAASRAGTLVVANLAMTALGVTAGVISARALGPAGRGDLAVLLYWPSFVYSVVDCAVMEIATLRVAQRPEGLRAHLKGGLAAALLFSIVGLAVGYLALPLLLRPEQGPLLADARWFLAYVPVALLAFVPQGALLGLQMFRSVAALRLSTSALYLAGVVAVAVTGHASASTFAWLAVASLAAQLPIGLALLAGRLAHAERGGPLELAGRIKDGVHLQGARIANVLGANVDRALASLTLSQTNIGLYQVPVMISQVFPVLPQALAELLFSQLAAANEGERAALTRTAYVRALMLSTLVAVSAASTLWFVVPLLYGASFGAAVAPATIVAFGGVVNGGALVLKSASRAAMCVRPCVEAEAVGISTTAVLGPWLAARYGLVGLAWSYAAGRAVCAAWMVARVPRDVSGGWRGLTPLSPAFRGEVALALRLLGARLFAAPSNAG